MGTFGSKNVQNTPRSDDFWKLTCRKSARRCGAKHILTKNAKITTRSGHFWKLRGRKSARRCGANHMWKSKGTKRLGLGPLFDDSMAIRCRKSARRCGAKHIWKSNASKTQGFEPLLLCQMSFCSEIDGHRKSKLSELG